MKASTELRYLTNHVLFTPIPRDLHLLPTLSICSMVADGGRIPQLTMFNYIKRHLTMGSRCNHLCSFLEGSRLGNML